MPSDFEGGFLRDNLTGALVVDLGATTVDIGAVQVQDASTTNQLHVLADGSLNVNSTPGIEQATGGSGAVNPALFKVIAGSDGTNVRPIKTDSSGVLQVDVAAGTVTTQAPLNQSVDGLGVPQPLQFAYFSVSTQQTGTSLVAAPAVGRSIRVLSYALVVGAAMNVSLIGAATTLLWPLAANGGISFAGTLQGPALQLASGTALTYSTSSAGQATGHVCYVVV